ncbi:MAG: ABC transporter permease [Myxococcales bacterium]|nr:ABC transporter permease [Myxococcales bacterium]
MSALARLGRLPLGATLVAIFGVAALVGPWLAPYSPRTIDLLAQFQTPSAAHPLGTADNGVDVLSVLLHGARLSALIALCSVGISLTVGSALGALAGYRGGRTDHLITGTADLVQAFPAIVLNIAILALVAEPGLLHVVLALSANGWVIFARIARAQTLLLRESEFVGAARLLGAGEAQILLRHVAPNLLGPLVVQATAALGAAILAESTLSFLGIGPGADASWGALLDQGSAVLLRFPHVALTAGAAIATTVLGFNLAGDWLRDRLDPRTRHSHRHPTRSGKSR